MGRTFDLMNRRRRPPDLIEAKVAAQILGVSTRTIQRQAGSGQLVVAAKIEGLRGAYLFDAVYIRSLATETREDDLRAS
jgi:hypothetical protein